MLKYITGIESSRSPHGERGLKFRQRRRQVELVRRSPHGERGLKLMHLVIGGYHWLSLPPRGAWIEIYMFVVGYLVLPVAPPTGSVD